MFINKIDNESILLTFLSILTLLTIVGCNDSKDGDGLGGPPPGPGPILAIDNLGFRGIGIDYDPEARCAYNCNPPWAPGCNPVACNPQPSFACNQNGLSNNPCNCQQCYDNDLNTIKNTLGLGAITIYQPNYFLLKAAQMQGVKVIFGTFNDTVAGLAQPETDNNCTYGGSPIPFCGTNYANVLFDGACGSTTPFNPTTFCSSGTFITAFDEFFTDGTIIGVQLGNEVLSSSNPPLTKNQAVTAAQSMRTVLNQRGFNNLPIIISLVAGQEQDFCENGAPQGDVNLIAAHPYCNFVASVPPSWPKNGADCFNQVLQIFSSTAQQFCGSGNTYIGETGYNTGCPMTEGNTHINDADTFIQAAVNWTCANEVPTFLFAFVDVCPETGCLPGCSGNIPNIGNGYFGLYFTQDYLTNGPLVQKFSPQPTLTCP